MRRVVGETADGLRRASLLPAYAEILLAVGDVEEARRACGELEEIAAQWQMDRRFTPQMSRDEAAALLARGTLTDARGAPLL